jgi:hypothetical protein
VYKLKLKIFRFFILLLFLFSTFNVVGINGEYFKIDVLTPMPNDEIDQQQNHSFGFWYICEPQWIAQSFIPSRPVLTRVFLLLVKMAEIDYEINVSIRKDLLDEDLASITLIPNLTVNSELWLEFDFEDINVNPGEKYYIVCLSHKGRYEGRNCYGWGHSTDNNSYPDGMTFVSHNKGLTWAILNYSSSTEPGDCCFITYGYDPHDKSDLKCDGDINWYNVKPGDIVYGNLSIQNIGFNGSLLDWEIKSIPDWGYWTFSKLEGDDLSPENGKLTVEVSVVAPEDKNKDFTGEIVVVNKNDIDDREVVQVSLTTYKVRNYNFYSIISLIKRVNVKSSFFLPNFDVLIIVCIFLFSIK